MSYSLFFQQMLLYQSTILKIWDEYNKNGYMFDHYQYDDHLMQKNYLTFAN